VDHEPDPNTDEGEPLKAKTFHEDGTWSPLPVEQTRAANFAELATAIPGGAAAVTREMVEKARYSWRDWNYWIKGMLDHQKSLEGYMALYDAMLDNTERPEIVKDRLGLSHFADSDLGRYWSDYWVKHPDEKPPGREPPPGTHWG